MRPAPTLRSALARLCSLAALGVLLPASSALAQQTRFAVVDMEPKGGHARLMGEVEREIARLRPNASPIEDEVMRRLLATGEGPGRAAQRLLAEAQRARATDDCKSAIEKSRTAETMMLTAMSIDEERDPLKSLYILQVICEARLGRAAPL